MKKILLAFIIIVFALKGNGQTNVIIIPLDSANHNFVYCPETVYQFMYEGMYYQPCDWSITPTTATLTGSGVSPYNAVFVTFPTAGSYTIGIGCTTSYSGTNNDFGKLIINVTCATGIEQISTTNKELNIYPNPNNGSFVIEPQNTLYNVRCTVYDVNGKAVLTQTINGRTSIDASYLNEGVYNISLQSTEGLVNKRVVIVK